MIYMHIKAWETLDNGLEVRKSKEGNQLDMSVQMRGCLYEWQHKGWEDSFRVYFGDSWFRSSSQLWGDFSRQTVIQRWISEKSLGLEIDLWVYWVTCFCISSVVLQCFIFYQHLHAVIFMENKPCFSEGCPSPARFPFEVLYCSSSPLLTPSQKMFWNSRPLLINTLPSP